MTLRFDPDKIRLARKIKGIETQEEFAALVGVPRQTVSLWETGEKKPSTDSLEKIVNTLNAKDISVSFFFTEQEE